jgi:alpha-galactosidase
MDAAATDFSVTATRLTELVDAEGFPSTGQWLRAAAVRFQTDWQGKNGDTRRETEVRLMWTPETFFVKFRAAYRNITVFSDSEPNGRRDHLWDRDVAEMFLQPNGSAPRRYKEFEVSPTGMWIDLDIDNGGLEDLRSGLMRRVALEAGKPLWNAELAIPMKSLVAAFDPDKTWRVNFYRVEGATEPRFYGAWSPTNTPEPNFHVPEAFGYLKFE